MAGDMQEPVQYANIDSGKVANKESLLRLSNNIKQYVDSAVSNAGGGGSYSAGTNISISNDTISTVASPTFTSISANTIETGDDSSNYFQSQKFRGEGDADTYYHAVDFGYAGHNQVDFYEYGGEYTFYECTSGQPSGATELLKITPNDVTYKGTSLLGGGGGYTLPTASTSTLGGVKIDGTSITIDANGVISATGGGGGGGGDADDISYDNTSSGLTASNVQDAIDELEDIMPIYTAGSNITINNGVISATGQITGTVDAVDVNFDNTDERMPIMVEADNAQDALVDIYQYCARNEDSISALYSQNFQSLLPYFVDYQDIQGANNNILPKASNREEFYSCIMQEKPFFITNSSVFITAAQWDELELTEVEEYNYSSPNTRDTIYKSNVLGWEYHPYKIGLAFKYGSVLKIFPTSSQYAMNPLNFMYVNTRNDSDPIFMSDWLADYYATKARIPTAPTTDGTYTLQCVVSSGTPTYSWVAVS